MTLPRVLKVLVFVNTLGVVLSCGGGGGSSPLPCSFTICRNEFEDYWAPPKQKARCVEQLRRSHHIIDPLEGSGSCPSPQPCSPVATQNRLFCKYGTMPVPSLDYEINYKSLLYRNLVPKTVVSYNDGSRLWTVVRRSWFVIQRLRPSLFQSISNLEIFVCLTAKLRGVTTLTRPVSGEQQNFSGNTEMLPGIGRLQKISGKHEIIPGHEAGKKKRKKKAGQDTT